MTLTQEQIREVVAREVARRADARAPGEPENFTHLLGSNSRGVPTPSTSPSLEKERALIEDITRRVSGAGPLQPLLDDSSIEEVWINAPDRVFVARSGVASRVDVTLTESDVRQIVERMLWHAGRRIDVSMPFVDASLPDGSRLHVVIPDVTPRHWAVNIRKFSASVRTLSDLVDARSLTQQAAEFLRMSVLAGLNIIVSGATQAGKTTMLNALMSQARAGERLITVEETRELNIAAADIVALQCRAANLEGTGEITLRRLISEALRMRPTRLIVGEVRGAECLDMLIALNSGLAGACSLHANSAREAVDKMMTLPLLAGGNVAAEFVSHAVATCVDVIVHCSLNRHGNRRVDEIAVVESVTNRPELTTVFRVNGDELGVDTCTLPNEDRFRSVGLNPRDVLERAS